MTASAVIAGLKTAIEANGYTVHNDRPVEDLRDKGAVIEQSDVEPVHEENATRHTGTFTVTLNDKISPKRRYSNERTRKEVCTEARTESRQGMSNGGLRPALPCNLE